MNIIKYAINKYRAFKHPVDYCRSLGAKIGDNCVVRASMLGTEPWLITIGNHVLLADGVRLLTHDGAGWCLRYNQEKGYYDIWGKIEIGNNVYIGVNSIIMPNVKITNNVIIGAGSIVTKSILEDGVYVGSPAKRIKTYDEWKKSVVNKAHNTYGMSITEKKAYFDKILDEHEE